jgi:DNA-binding FadR family transcriptional regulator
MAGHLFGQRFGVFWLMVWCASCRKAASLSQRSMRPKELKLLEVRLELERLLTKCAVHRATDEHRALMRVIIEQLRTEVPKESLRFGQLLRDVHEVLTRAADNEFLTSLMDRVHALSRRFWYAHHEKLGDVTQAATLHAERLVHVVNGDLKRAEAASDAIVAYVEAYVRRLVD